MTLTLSILSSLAIGFCLGFYVGIYRPCSHETPEVPSLEGAEDDL